ncbi:MAG: tRNA guanosine(34) transglycosylase Tgt, partial [Candidatus Magasanikbacteria bacterium]|nr:tRNA guanosine(34) transglycosylase Tgt [Candidatus Magasanikbacteria bacterium]
IDDEGVTFRSHIDGSEHRFTPKSAIETQHKLGADIIMAFDECTPDEADSTYTKKAMERTHRWAKECLDTHKKNTKHHGYNQFLFGIIQGANHKNLREESAKIISSMDFDGIAIGGESVGYNMEATKNILDWVNPIIPEDKPHYTMGLGHSPKDLFDVVEKGIDIFDCVSPTRMARNGTLFVHKKISNTYRINITNAVHKRDKITIDPLLENSPVGHYSRAYLHHLFNTSELLAYSIASMHNLYFLLNLSKQIREAIKENRFQELKNEWI